MEMSLLYLIQGLHFSELDKLMVVLCDTILGSKGQFWVILGILMLLVPKTRKCACCVLISYLIAYFVGDGILKDIICRVRPCDVDTSVKLLISRPSSYSCPSVHAMLAFACACSIWKSFKFAGFLAFVYACVIGFSRTYFFVHYCSDVIIGAVLGIIIASIVCKLLKFEFFLK